MPIIQPVLIKVRGRFDSMHAADGGFMDIYYWQDVVVVPPEPVEEKKPAFPDTVESEIVPGLTFHIFSGAIQYKDGDPKSPKPGVFRALQYLESRAAIAAQDEMRSMCWVELGTGSALRSLISDIGDFLTEIGVKEQVSQWTDENGEKFVVWK